tara:strand:+ start:273 stop:563 length:291 start_codon:yes stop_codon:yes gene_type:complete
MYVVMCSDGTLYTGVTTDLDRRVNEHNNSKKGAKYTRSRRPVQLIYRTICNNRSDAQKKEYKFKSLKRLEKMKIINEFNLWKYEGCTPHQFTSSEK